MAAKSTTPAHDELARLQQRIAEARQAERRAEMDRLTADRDVEEVRDQVREKHDLGGDATTATEALQAAKVAAEEAQLAQEGVARRAQRANADMVAFTEENADRLLAELGPQCDQVAADILAAAENLMAQNARWQELSVQVSALLRAQHVQPADAAPAGHELTQVLRDLKRAMPDEIRTPMPLTRVA